MKQHDNHSDDAKQNGKHARKHKTLVRIAYWNINGLKTKNKMETIRTLTTDYDFIFLTETKTTKADERQIQTAWGKGYVFDWAHGKSNRNGICLIMRKKEEWEHEITVEKDSKGRWIELTIGGGIAAAKSCRIVGAYAPSKPAERRIWLPKMLKRWKEWPGELMIAADWNFTTNQHIDRWTEGEPRIQRKEAGAAEMEDWMIDNDMGDVYRLHFGNITATGDGWTCKRQTKKGTSKSRIDRFLISDNSAWRAETVGIAAYDGEVSDHRMIYMHWKFDGKRNENRLWRLDDATIQHPDFRRRVAATLKEAEEKMKVNDATETWSWVKQRITAAGKLIQKKEGKRAAFEKKKHENERNALNQLENATTRRLSKAPQDSSLGMMVREWRWMARKLGANLRRGLRKALRGGLQFAEQTRNQVSLKLASQKPPADEEQTRAKNQLCGKLKHLLQLIRDRRVSLEQASRKTATRTVKRNRREDDLQAALKTAQAARAFLRRSTNRQAATRGGIAALRRDSGPDMKTYTDESTKHEIATEFYEDLWKKRDTHNEDQEKLLKTIKQRLTPTEKKQINAPMTVEEVEKAMSKLSSGKAPGIDGIPIDFYKSFKKSLAPILHAALTEMVQSKRMNDDMRNAVVTILYKKRDRELMKNYRPISLLGTDYKILAKLLAERLKQVLPKLVHPDQQGFVKDGDIRGNILLQKLATRYCQEPNTGREKLWEQAWEMMETDEEDQLDDHAFYTKGGITVFYDGEKAYDRQDRAFMGRVMRKMGLGEYEGDDFFLRAVETLYVDTEATLKINGYLTRTIKVLGGVRQGCPLSCYLYILVVEPLAELMRQDNDIKGIPVPGNKNGRTVKVALFADDLTGYMLDWKSLVAMSKCMTVFERASGAKVNAEKTFVLVMGSRWEGCEEKKLSETGLGYAMMEADQVERYLGELITHNGQDSGDYRQALLKAKKVTNGWMQLRTTPQNRVRIANLLVLSKILYRTGVAALGATEIRGMQQIMNEYVWKKKKTKPALKWSRRKWEEGGLELRDVRLMALASRCRVLQHLWRAYSTENTPPAWVCWLLRELKRTLKSKNLKLHEMWNGKRDGNNRRAGNPFPLKEKKDLEWKDDHFAESCARVWWTLRSRTKEGIEWANAEITKLQVVIDPNDPDNPQQKKTVAKLQKLQDDI